MRNHIEIRSRQELPIFHHQDGQEKFSSGTAQDTELGVYIYDLDPL